MKPLLLFLCLLTLCSVYSCDDDDGNGVVPTTAEYVEPEPPPGFTAEFATVNGVRLRYLRGGTGAEAVLLVHGWPQTWYEWHRLMPELARDYTVIVPDLRGTGSSDRPAYGEEGYPKTLLATDLHELVRSLGFNSVRYVGHDIGGMTGYAYAHLFPEETEQLVIMDVPLPGIEPVWSMVLQQYELSWHFGFFQDAGAEEIVAGDEEEFIRDFVLKLTFDPDLFPEEDLEVAIAAHSGVDRLRGGFGWYRGFGQDTEEFAEFAGTRLTMPVLGMGGEVSSGPLMAPLLSGLVDTTQLTTFVVPESGHWLMEEQPQVVLDQLLTFFNQ